MAPVHLTPSSSAPGRQSNFGKARRRGRSLECLVQMPLDVVYEVPQMLSLIGRVLLDLIVLTPDIQSSQPAGFALSWSFEQDS